MADAQSSQSREPQKPDGKFNSEVIYERTNCRKDAITRRETVEEKKGGTSNDGMHRRTMMRIGCGARSRSRHRSRVRSISPEIMRRNIKSKNKKN